MNIPGRSLTKPLSAGAFSAPDEDAGVQLILESYESLQVDDVRRQVQAYLNAGYAGERLLRELGGAILRDDTGAEILPTLRTTFEEWELIEGHPARDQLLRGFVRYATNLRFGKDSHDSAQTALRFARGLTMVEAYGSEA